MSKPEAQSPAAENINTIARLEQQFLERRTVVQRIGDTIGAFAGSMAFVVLHIVVLTLWFLINSGTLPLIRPFDPYPYMFLSMAVSIEAVLLSTFVLMKQNRESKRAEQREQLTLQIDMLSEQEITKALQLLQRVCDRLGIRDAQDPEVKLLAENTAVEDLVQQIKDKLPEES
jgi:uncharacterized membrane protein